MPEIAATDGSCRVIGNSLDSIQPELLK